MCECIQNIIKTIINALSCDISDLIAISALVISLSTFFVNFNRNKKLETIKDFNELRYKYPDITIDIEKRDDFLRDMERFSVAVNKKIYDINIINQMSGTLLLCQYSDVEDFIATKDEKYYKEYKKFIEKLRKKQND